MLKEIEKRISKIEEAVRPPSPVLFLTEDENGRDKWVTIEEWLKYSRETGECATKIRPGLPVNYADIDRYLDNMKSIAWEHGGL